MGVLKYLVILEELRQSVSLREHKPLLEFQKLIKIVGLLLHDLVHLCYGIINAYMIMAPIRTPHGRISAYV